MAKGKQGKPAQSLVEMARSIAPPDCRTGSKPWIDKLPTEHRDMLLELREAFATDKLKGWTPRTMLSELIIPAGINIGISLQTFRHWIYQYGK